jgi:FSR family fosmidomycin resistance protein-like MFS transporter
VLTVGNLFGLVGGLVPLALGSIAEHYDLRVSMWLLLAGPLALLVGLPRRVTGNEGKEGDQVTCGT